jgi:hypothetical protein
MIARSSWLIFFGLMFLYGSAQYKWKMTRDEDGIKIFESEKAGAKFKSVKVETTLEGNYDKLIAVLTDISNHKEWIYNTKTSYLIKRITPYDLYYYSEAIMPWPTTNRDAVVHLRIIRDSLPKFLKVSALSEPNFIGKKEGKVRVPYSSATWFVTMPTSRTIHIVYVFEADPGGSLPAWLVNMFADKGPYESFKKLGEILKK